MFSIEDRLPPDAERLRIELRWLAQRLGAVRDLDVQLQHARRQGQALEVSDGLRAYVAWLEVQRQRARHSLVAALDDARYASLVDALERAGAAWEPLADHDADLAADAPARLRALWRKLRRAGARLAADTSPEQLHRTRIRAKRVRYAVEFHVDLYGQPARAFVKRIVDLQDALGEYQDGIVCRQQIESALADGGLAWSGQTTLALHVERNVG